MPLTEIEREITKSVAQYFYVQREPTSHEQLLRAFNDPRPITNLRDRLRIISAQGVPPQQTYFPTILAFQYCGDETLRQNAKSAVEAGLKRLQIPFQGDYHQKRQHKVRALILESQPPKCCNSTDGDVRTFLLK